MTSTKILMAVAAAAICLTAAACSKPAETTDASSAAAEMPADTGGAMSDMAMSDSASS